MDAVLRYDINEFLIVLKQIFWMAKTPTEYCVLNNLKIFDKIYTDFADNLANVITIC